MAVRVILTSVAAHTRNGVQLLSFRHLATIASQKSMQTMDNTVIADRRLLGDILTCA
jgi:hypothetical protein